MSTKMSSSKRYDTNPFLADMIVPMSSKKVQLSKLGSKGDVFINQTTGEIRGTHVTTYKKVDAEKFVKLFSRNIGLTFGLRASGIKAFNVLIWAVQKCTSGMDQVYLDTLALNNFLATNSFKLSLPTLKRGLKELEEAQIIAKTMRRGCYFINPNFCFNGDRIAFTTVIEREEKEGKLTHE